MHELGRQAEALRRGGPVQHLAHALDGRAGGEAADVVAEFGKCHGAADDRAGGRVVVRGAEFDQMLGLGGMLRRGHVHLHVDSLDHVQPRGGGQVIAGHVAAIQARRALQPG